MNYSKKEITTAYHEAGHAVAAFSNVIRFEYVTIISNEDSLGHIQYNKKTITKRSNIIEQAKTNSITPNMKDFIERSLIVMYAGFVAEKIFTGKNNFIGASSDMDKMIDILFGISGSKKAVTAYLDYLKIITECLFISDEHKETHLWNFAKEIAEKLLEKKTLTYDEVKGLYLSAISNNPPAKK